MRKSRSTSTRKDSLSPTYLSTVARRTLKLSKKTQEVSFSSSRALELSSVSSSFLSLYELSLIFLSQLYLPIYSANPLSRSLISKGQALLPRSSFHGALSKSLPFGECWRPPAVHSGAVQRGAQLFLAAREAGVPGPAPRSSPGKGDHHDPNVLRAPVCLAAQLEIAGALDNHGGCILTMRCLARLISTPFQTCYVQESGFVNTKGRRKRERAMS